MLCGGGRASGVSDTSPSAAVKTHRVAQLTLGALREKIGISTSRTTTGEVQCRPRSDLLCGGGRASGVSDTSPSVVVKTYQTYYTSYSLTLPLKPVKQSLSQRTGVLAENELPACAALVCGEQVDTALLYHRPTVIPNRPTYTSHSPCRRNQSNEACHSGLAYRLRMSDHPDPEQPADNTWILHYSIRVAL